MRITNLTFLAFQLNAALDTGRYNDITFREVLGHINAGTVFSFLENRVGEDVDLSLFDAPKRQALVDEWQSLMNVVDARRKFGVEKNGLCLLMAYVIEGIQRRQDTNPKVLTE